MDNAELKNALLSKRPIILKHLTLEVEYKCVSAIIYREKEGNVDISAELLDKNEWSVTICDPSQIRYKES